MRLIDADALTKKLNEFCGNQRYLIPEQVWKIVEEQPTVYDPEKVADCLEKASTLYSLSERDCEFAIRQDLALHIVRKGSIK